MSWKVIELEDGTAVVDGAGIGGFRVLNKYAAELAVQFLEAESSRRPALVIGEKVDASIIPFELTGDLFCECGEVIDVYECTMPFYAQCSACKKDWKVSAVMELREIEASR